MSGRGPRLISVKRGEPIGSLEVGSKIKLNVNGAPLEFLIAHQGLPSDIYDISCNGTWLLMKDIYENRAWHSSKVNDYANSTINTWLNNDFFGLLDSNIQSAVKQVKIPYRAGSGYGKTVTSGANGLSAKIFLLSASEVALSNSNVPTNEGATLSYFVDCAANAADAKRVAHLSDSAAIWWLRSPYCLSLRGSEAASDVAADGSWSGGYCSNSRGIRPGLILPSDFVVADNMIA